MDTGGSVLLDWRCNVVGVVDPFNVSQPNPLLPALPEKTQQPFVLARPSASRDLPFSDDALRDKEERARQFLARMASDSGGQCQPGGDTESCWETVETEIGIDRRGRITRGLVRGQDCQVDSCDAPTDGVLA